MSDNRIACVELPAELAEIVEGLLLQEAQQIRYGDTADPRAGRLLRRHDRAAVVWNLYDAADRVRRAVRAAS